MPSTQLLLIGEDEEGIGAVGHAQQDGGSDAVFVPVIGVALRLRGSKSGLRVGEQLAERIIDWAVARADADGYRRLTLWGYVHRSNAACHSLCHRIAADTFDGHGAFDRWVANIEIE